MKPHWRVLGVRDYDMGSTWSMSQPAPRVEVLSRFLPAPSVAMLRPVDQRCKKRLADQQTGAYRDVDESRDVDPLSTK